MSEVTVTIKAQNRASSVLKQVDSDIKKTTQGWRGKFQDFTNQVRGMFGGGPLQNMLGGMLAKLGPLGAGVAALTAALAAGVAKATQFAGSIQDSANAVGFGYRQFQNLSYIAMDNGVNMERLTTILSKFQSAQNDIASNKQMQKAFERLGISVNEVAALNPDELLQRVAKGFKATGDIGALYDIFGKGAGEVKTMLADLAKSGSDLDGMIGVNIVSEEAISALDRLGDGFEKLKRRAGSALTELAGQSVKWAQGISDFWNNVFAGQGMAKSADMIGKAQAEATKESLDAKAAEEEAAAAARKRALDEAQAEEAKKQLKADNAELDKLAQNDIEKNAEDQKRIANEQKTFEKQLEGLGRKRVNLFDPRGDMSAEDLQKEQAGRIFNTRSDMQARRAERAADRTRKRMERLADQANFVEARGGTASRRGRLAREFLQRQQDIKAAQQNIEQRKKQAEEAQIKGAEIQAAMKHRLDFMLFALSDQLDEQQKQEKIQARIEKNTAFLSKAVAIEGGE